MALPSSWEYIYPVYTCTMYLYRGPSGPSDLSNKSVLRMTFYKRCVQYSAYVHENVYLPPISSHCLMLLCSYQIFTHSFASQVNIYILVCTFKHMKRTCIHAGVYLPHTRENPNICRQPELLERGTQGIPQTSFRYNVSLWSGGESHYFRLWFQLSQVAPAEPCGCL